MREAGTNPTIPNVSQNTALMVGGRLFVSTVGGVIAALEYAKSIAPHHVTAVYVNLDDEATQKLREKWQQWGSGVNLVVVASPYRSLLRPLLNYVDRVKRSSRGEVVTIVLPEFVPAKWWQNLLHNHNSLFLKGALLFKKGIVVTNVPYHLEH